MNFFEQAVHEYLTQVLGLLTLPDFKVKRNEQGKSWSAQIDFLALDFEADRILLVEVTANKDFPDWLVNKVKSVKDTQTIGWHVRTKVLKGKIQDDYRLAWVLIVPEKHVSGLRKETSSPNNSRFLKTRKASYGTNTLLRRCLNGQRRLSLGSRYHNTVSAVS